MLKYSVILEMHQAYFELLLVALSELFLKIINC